MKALRSNSVWPTRNTDSVYLCVHLWALQNISDLMTILGRSWKYAVQNICSESSCESGLESCCARPDDDDDDDDAEDSCLHWITLSLAISLLLPWLSFHWFHSFHSFQHSQGLPLWIRSSIAFFLAMNWSERNLCVNLQRSRKNERKKKRRRRPSTLDTLDGEASIFFVSSLLHGLLSVSVVVLCCIFFSICFVLILAPVSFAPSRVSCEALQAKQDRRAQRVWNLMRKSWILTIFWQYFKYLQVILLQFWTFWMAWSYQYQWFSQDTMNKSGIVKPSKSWSSHKRSREEESEESERVLQRETTWFSEEEVMKGNPLLADGADVSLKRTGDLSSKAR